MGEQWRVKVEHHYNFAADQVNVWIGQRNDLGDVRMVQAIHMDKEVSYPKDVMFVLGDPINTYQATEPTFAIPRELVQALFEALVPVMVGTDSANILGLIRELRRERDDANRRLDALISGIGRLGGATAPGKLPSGNQP
jgi:hypothetical protein